MTTNWEGIYGEHRTVGPHRAWCFACQEWCYSLPDGPLCQHCGASADIVDHLTPRLDEPWEKAPMGNGQYYLRVPGMDWAATWPMNEAVLDRIIADHEASLTRPPR